MKIGIITGGHQKSSTGIGNYISNLVKNLPVQSDEISIIRHPTGYDYDIKNQIVPWAPKISNMMHWSWLTYLQKYRLKPLDIIHSPAFCFFPYKPHKNYVLTVHDVIFRLNPEFCTKDVINYGKKYFLKNLNFADLIIAVSYSTKQDLIEFYNIPKNKIKVIHEAGSNLFKPLDYDNILKIREKYNLINPFLLFVGTLEPRKNISLILESFSQCIKSHPDIDLVLAGGYGWKYEEIFEKIRDLNIKQKVHLLGYVPEEDLPGLYNAAKIFLFPSFYEGFGLPVLEAMQCGIPVITSNCSSFPEIIGPEGLSVNPKDVNGLTNHIDKLLSDSDFYLYQSQYGINRANQFSWKKTAEETYMIYNEILRKKF